VDVYREKHVGT